MLFDTHDEKRSRIGETSSDRWATYDQVRVASKSNGNSWRESKPLAIAFRKNLCSERSETLGNSILKILSFLFIDWASFKT